MSLSIIVKGNLISGDIYGVFRSKHASIAGLAANSVHGVKASIEAVGASARIAASQAIAKRNAKYAKQGSTA